MTYTQNAPSSDEASSLTYVLDTSLFLQNTSSFDLLCDLGVHLDLPLYVIEELDHFKDELTERGERARFFTRKLNQLPLVHQSSAQFPSLNLPNGGILRIVELRNPPQNQRWSSSLYYDELILHCISLQNLKLQPSFESSSNQRILLTQDLNLRLRSFARGYQVARWHPEWGIIHNQDKIDLDLEASASQLSYPYIENISLDPHASEIQRGSLDDALIHFSLPEEVETHQSLLVESSNTVNEADLHVDAKDQTERADTLSVPQDRDQKTHQESSSNSYSSDQIEEDKILQKMSFDEIPFEPYISKDEHPLVGPPQSTPSKVQKKQDIALYANQIVYLSKDSTSQLESQQVNPNQPDSKQQWLLGCLDDTSNQWIYPPSHPYWGLTPLNEEQRVALYFLTQPHLSLVCLTGKAGTGKTLLALAAGLSQVMESKRYERVLVSRAIFPLGRDLGYLPGTLEEKMDPWLQPIYDNLEFLLGKNTSRTPHRKKLHLEEFLDMGPIEINPITYMRGRSIPRQYLLIDEAQNLTTHEVKTLLTRAGQGTKVILIGDPHQVDHPDLDAHSNGLAYVVKRFQGQKCAGIIHLTQGHRSSLAELAADLL